MALRPLGVARHTGSPPGKSGNEMSRWKTVEWFGPPSRHSSDKVKMQETSIDVNRSPVCHSIVMTLQKRI